MHLSSEVSKRLLEKLLSFYDPPRSWTDVFAVGKEKPAEGWDESYHDDIKAVAQSHFAKDHPLSVTEIHEGLQALSRQKYFKRWVLGHQQTMKELFSFCSAVELMLPDEASTMFADLLDSQRKPDERVLDAADRATDILNQHNKLSDIRYRPVTYLVPSLILAYSFPSMYPRIKYTRIKRIASLYGEKIIPGRDGVRDMYDFVISFRRSCEEYVMVRDMIDAYVMIDILYDL
jgi:hypothetical protein